MMEIQVINFQNSSVGKVKLTDEIYNAPVREDLMARAVHAQLATKRAGTHKSKNLSEVSGTTKKPFKQKGTGNARQGTLRAPQMRGGGDVFGKRPNDHSYSLPKKVMKAALKSALSVKCRDKKLVILETLNCENPKTKLVQGFMNMLQAKSALFVDGEALNTIFSLASRNIPLVKALPSKGINVYDILKHEFLFLTKDAVEQLEKRLNVAE
jgi:large subunit ribosomal protein L4